MTFLSTLTQGLLRQVRRGQDQENGEFKRIKDQ